MPGGPSGGTAVGGNRTGTGKCRNAESHPAAHSSSHWNPSDGVKQIHGKHKVEMFHAEI